MTKDLFDGSSEDNLFEAKFIAYLIAEITWKVLAGLALLVFKDDLNGFVLILLMAIIVTAGFVEVGFILGQASLDKFVRLAKIAASTGAKVRPQIKGMVVSDEDSGKPG